MIRSFKGDAARAILRELKRPRDVSAPVAKSALRRLRQLDDAELLDDMRDPPGNRLHALKDDRAGQWSVSVNDQYRVCFRWIDGGAEDVELVDYH